MLSALSTSVALRLPEVVSAISVSVRLSVVSPVMMAASLTGLTMTTTVSVSVPLLPSLTV